MDKEEGLKFCRVQLLRLATFLQSYLPLANTHTVDFLIENMWESHVPPTIRDQLLDLHHEELVALPEKLPTHLLEDCDEDQVKDEVNGETSADAISCMTNSTKCVRSRPKLNRQQKCVWRHQNLKPFVKSAHLHTLKGLNVLSLKDNLPVEEGKSFHMRDFMCAKKAHEVEVMASVCAGLCNKHTVDQVVDIGSGLGYLSGHMAFLHNLKVLGIDSSNLNTHGADKRSARLTKHWPLLLANAQLTQLGLTPVRTKGKNRLKHLQKSAETGASDAFEDVKPEDYIPPEKFASLATKLKVAKQLSPKGCFQPVTMYVTQETDLLDLIHHNFKDTTIQGPSCDVQRDVSEACDNTGHKSGTVAYNIDSSESNNFAVLGKVDSIRSKNQAFALTGLHTCGSLASSVLKLFISNSSAISLCNVGCCYHLIDEEFIRSPFEKDDDPDPTEFGFPLSRCLLDRQFYLGRNARMLACQAPARLSSASEHPDKMGPQRSLYWRAVLQVILRDVTEESRDDWNVGKLANKCTSFLEYVRKALEKLKIVHQLSDSQIRDYEEKFEPAANHIKCFFYLRATLSACIESIILLDRLVFLMEQDCVSEAFLVELFDPKTSPRCWALIASK